jgi:hypothetical protein
MSLNLETDICLDFDLEGFQVLVEVGIMFMVSIVMFGLLLLVRIYGGQQVTRRVIEYASMITLAAVVHFTTLRKPGMTALGYVNVTEIMISLVCAYKIVRLVLKW